LDLSSTLVYVLKLTEPAVPSRGSRPYRPGRGRVGGPAGLLGASEPDEGGAFARWALRDRDLVVEGGRLRDLDRARDVVGGAGAWGVAAVIVSIFFVKSSPPPPLLSGVEVCSVGR